MLKRAILGQTNFIDRDYIEDLNPLMSKYKEIERNMRNNGLIVKSISTVHKPFLYAAFALNKECNSKFATVRTLYHATQPDNIDSILSTNLDWRLSRRCKYGYGVSFSPDPAYAHTYSNGYDDDKAMIIAEVICNSVSISDYALKIPPEGYDTTRSSNDKVYVKYNHDEFYPEYIAYYTAKRL